ncbi:MAG TPA: CaiB/BaiF CoA-transferase family protein [Candidimonas sp.]|nr:CaiB/BaiF CoA-transferase family protein [Candidimonas sp.]
MTTLNTNGTGVLAGVTIVEVAAIGPVPWGLTLLARMGAQITRIRRPPAPADARKTAPHLFGDIGRDDVFLDLKSQADVEQALALISKADVLVEGMRPRVMERLGLGPAVCLAANPGLVYARVTGWGQDGPLAQRAGHDINYISLSGALHAIGVKDQAPVIPLNLIGDYGGGGAFMALGIVAAVLSQRSTGKGQVIDVSMLDGSANLMALAYERHALGLWEDKRGENILDGGAPWYSVYRTQDDKYMAVGAIEPQFYLELLAGLGLDAATVPDRTDRGNWDKLRAMFAQLFAKKTRQEWSAIFEEMDACVTPVLSMREAPLHPHNVARQTFVKDDTVIRPNVAPRFD